MSYQEHQNWKAHVVTMIECYVIAKTQSNKNGNRFGDESAALMYCEKIIALLDRPSCPACGVREAINSNDPKWIPPYARTACDSTGRTDSFGIDNTTLNWINSQMSSDSSGSSSSDSSSSFDSGGGSSGGGGGSGDF